MEFNIQCHDGLFEIKTSGYAELEKFRDIFDALFTHDKWEPGTPILVDHTELNSTTLTINEVYNIANSCEQYKAQFEQSKCALVVARDIEFGMASIWQVYVENKCSVNEKLFRTRDEAMAWLSV